MHQELRLSDDQTLYYRYNPQADVLAVRFKPDFKAADERPLPAQPSISTSHDLDGGSVLGLRISGVQQLLLQSLIRDAITLAAPALGTAAPTVIAPRTDAEPAVPFASPAAQQVTPIVAKSDAQTVVQPVVQPIVQPVAPPIAPPIVQPIAQSFAQPIPQPVATVAASAPATVSAAAIGMAADEPIDTLDEDDMDEDDGSAAEPRRRRRRRRRRPLLSAAGGHPAAEDGDDVLVSIALVNADRPREQPAAPTPNLPQVQPAAYQPPAQLGPPSQDGNRRVADTATDRPPADADRAASTAAALTTAVPLTSAVPLTLAHLDEPVVEAGADAAAETETEQNAEGERRRRRRRRGRRGADGAAEAGAEPLSLAEDEEDELPGDPEAEAHWDDEGRPCPETFLPLRLHPRVAHAISDLGFSSPTPIQVEAIPVALSGEDLVGLAQTGTGKTLAFVAPSLTRLLSGERPGNRPRMVILTPTRELAVQVALEAERLAAHTDLRVATIYGGVSMSQQTDDLRRGVDVVVATPGRILDHLRRRNVVLDAVEVLVLDEADRMLDMGFLPDVRAIIRQLPSQRQTMLFTATFPPEIESLSLEFQSKPRTVEIARRRPPESIDQRLYPVGRHLKAPLLVHLLETDATMDRVLIFTERKIDADVLARKLRQDGISVALMHGDRTQVDREKALAALKSHQVRVLVATNVAARGLDIEEISHVVNYDVPQSIDEYVHRIGRTARAESLGKAYSFVTLGDEPMISRIEAALGRQLPRVQAPGFDYDVTPPSWAKPSGNDVLAWLNKETSVVDRLRSLSRRRR